MAQNTVGYTKQLLVLPFDHRASFAEKMFGIKGVPTPEQTKLIASYKMMIYEGFEKAVASGLPRDMMGILTDEQFGSDVLARAKQGGFTTCVCVEKSGQDEFDFEYGADFGKHIDKFNPDFVKVLVRYNPEGDRGLNERQSAKLLQLSKYLHNANRKFMFELLVPPTTEQLEKCKGDKNMFDVEVRPMLMVRAIQELQKFGIEADVWKLEGLDREADFQRVVETARSGGRTDVGCILLGRGENEAKVRAWLKVGANVPGVIGFAVGRTVFWEPLKGFQDGRYTREQAVGKMCDTYSSLCKMWLEERA
jgi:myo-inositol catabolism protein IolC